MANRIKESQCYVSNVLADELTFHQNISEGLKSRHMSPDIQAYLDDFRAKCQGDSEPFDVATPRRTRKAMAKPSTVGGEQQQPSQPQSLADGETEQSATAANDDESKTKDALRSAEILLQDPVSTLLWTSDMDSGAEKTSRGQPSPEEDRYAMFRSLLRGQGMQLDDGSDSQMRRVLPVTKRPILRRSGKLLLADNTTGFLGAEQFLAPEMLFTPELFPTLQIENAVAGASRLVDVVLSEADADIESELLQNVVLAGGSSRLPGFSTRLCSDIRRWRGENAVMQTTMAAGGGGDCGEVWRGAAIIAQLPAFRQNAITARDLAEYGTGVFRRIGL